MYLSGKRYKSTSLDENAGIMELEVVTCFGWRHGSHCYGTTWLLFVGGQNS